MQRQHDDHAGKQLRFFEGYRRRGSIRDKAVIFYLRDAASHDAAIISSNTLALWGGNP